MYNELKADSKEPSQIRIRREYTQGLRSLLDCYGSETEEECGRRVAWLCICRPQLT